MNTWQLLRRMQGILRARRWDGSSSSRPVFASQSVIVSAAPPEESFPSLASPVAILAPLDANADQEDTGLFRQRVSLTLIVSVAGDKFGEFALMGGARQGSDRSDNRGLLEVESEVFACLRQLSAASGVVIKATLSTGSDARLEESGSYTVLRSYVFEADVTTFRHYEEARAFVAVVTSTVALSWSAPSDTTALVTYTLRRITGSVPPVLPTDGTAVTLSSALATSKTDSPGAGVWSYALFAGYDDLGGATAIYHSTPRTLTVTV